jgi:hypothetical protein
MPNIEEWKFSLDVAWDDPWYRWQGIGTIALAVLGSVFFLWRMIPEGLQSGLLVLHYNLYVGIDEVQPWPWVLAMPAALLVIVGLDLLAAGFLFRRDRVASRVMLCTATLFTLLALGGGFFLTLVNL